MMVSRCFMLILIFFVGFYCWYPFLVFQRCVHLSFLSSAHGSRKVILCQIYCIFLIHQGLFYTFFYLVGIPRRRVISTFTPGFNSELPARNLGLWLKCPNMAQLISPPAGWVEICYDGLKLHKKPGNLQPVFFFIICLMLLPSVDIWTPGMTFFGCLKVDVLWSWEKLGAAYLNLRKYLKAGNSWLTGCNIWKCLFVAQFLILNSSLNCLFQGWNILTSL